MPGVQQNDDPLRTNFKLSGGGEDIALFGRLDAGNDLIDSYTFGAQAADTSQGRQTDGSSTWVFFGTPTPGASNGATPECCVGTVGNVNYDAQDNCDISDLTALVNHLFVTFEALGPC